MSTAKNGLSAIEIYENLTGERWDDLSARVRYLMRFLPPDADISDIEFALHFDERAQVPR